MSHAQKNRVTVCATVEGDYCESYCALDNLPDRSGESEKPSNVGEKGDNEGVDEQNALRNYQGVEKGLGEFETSNRFFYWAFPDVFESDIAPDWDPEVFRVLDQGKAAPRELRDFTEDSGVRVSVSRGYHTRFRAIDAKASYSGKFVQQLQRRRIYAIPNVVMAMSSAKA